MRNIFLSKRESSAKRLFKTNLAYALIFIATEINLSLPPRDELQYFILD